MSTALEKKKYTYEDYLKIPEEERYELIEGELLMTPAPVPSHQEISGNLYSELRRFVTENDLGKIFYAPCDVYLDNENVVQPDILFISKERLNIIGEKNIEGPPDLAIEIISESAAYRDLVQKKKLYARFGVKEYWIVLPREESIEVYNLKNSTYTLSNTYNKNNILESAYLKGLRIELKKIL